MKKLLFAITFALFFSCNDGDIEVQVIDFEQGTIDSCDSVISTSTSILFKINDTEAIILELASGLLKNEITAEGTSIQSNIPTSKLTYRTFSDKVSKTYFCSDIPPATPMVVEELEAKSGTVIITTTTDTDSINFSHNIQLEDVVFITESDTQISDLNLNSFGIITTKKEE